MIKSKPWSHVIRSQCKTVVGQTLCRKSSDRTNAEINYNMAIQYRS